MRTKLMVAGCITLLCGTLSGCPAFVAGGAATGAAVVNDPRAPGTMVEDQAIEIKAGRALEADAEINERTHFNVTSYNKVVLLTGEAPTRELRTRMADIVSRVPGVRRVYNELALAQPSSLTSRSSDTLITTKVKTRLFGEEKLDATRIKVVTERGIVYLLGLVSRQEADQAAEAARTVSGVQKVVKLFEITGEPPNAG